MSKIKIRLILITLFLLPAYLIKIKFGWVSFNVLELLVAALFLLWIFNKERKYPPTGDHPQGDKTPNIPLRGIIRRVTKYSLPIALIFTGLMLSVIANGNYYTGLGAIKGWFIIPIISGIVFYDALKKDESFLKKTMLALFFSGVAISAIGVIYKFLGFLTFDGRLKIFWDSPNQLAMFLAVPLLIGISRFDLEELQKVRLWGIPATCLPEGKSRTLNWKSAAIFFGLSFILLNLYFTKSYGAWLAIAVAIFAIFWLEYSKKWQKKYLTILSLVLAILISLASVYKYKSIANMGERSSLASRAAIWKSAGLMIENNPLFGIGPGNFQEKYLEYQKYFPSYLEWSAPQPHNIFLAFWLESGMIGLIGFLILLFYFFRDNKIAIRNNRDLGILFLGIMICILIHGLVDTTYWRNDLAVVFWMVISMNFYLAKLPAKLN